MTDPTYAGLIARLRNARFFSVQYSLGSNIIGEAADALEAQGREVERLYREKADAIDEAVRLRTYEKIINDGAHNLSDRLEIERLRGELQLARSHIVRTCQALGEWCDETDAEALKRLDAALAGKPSGVILK
jgi:hypothetical protein